MTLEEHLRILIGDLVLRVAQLASEVDVLKAQIADQKAPPQNTDRPTT